MTERVIGYPACHGGLNNQKLALLGLLEMAHRERRSLALPRIVNLDPASGSSIGHFHFGELFSVPAFRAHAATLGVDLVADSYAKTTTDGEAFALGNALEPTKRRAFLQALQPSDAVAGLIKNAVVAAFASSPQRVGAQLRIEHDWITHTKERLMHAQGEDNVPNFITILQRISAVTGPARVYLTCDERALSVDKATIEQVAKDRFGLSIVWKSDVVDVAALNGQLALLTEIDFRIAQACDLYFGTTRSTFSNMVASVGHGLHYAYNLPGDSAKLRHDGGMHASAVLATSSIDQSMSVQRIVVGRDAPV